MVEDTLSLAGECIGVDKLLELLWKYVTKKRHQSSLSHKHMGEKVAMTHLFQSPLIEELLKCFFLVDNLELNSGLDIPISIASRLSLPLGFSVVARGGAERWPMGLAILQLFQGGLVSFAFAES